MQKKKQPEAFKVSVFKNFLNGEHIAVCSMEDVVRMIRRGDYAEAISDYRCAAPAMLSSAGGGEVVRSGVRMASNNIPRLCFAAEYRRHNGSRQLLRRNGLVLIEIDGLKDFDTAVNSVMRPPDSFILSLCSLVRMDVRLKFCAAFRGLTAVCRLTMPLFVALWLKDIGVCTMCIRRSSM